MRESSSRRAGRSDGVPSGGCADPQGQVLKKTLDSQQASALVHRLTQLSEKEQEMSGCLQYIFRDHSLSMLSSVKPAARAIWEDPARGKGVPRHHSLSQHPFAPGPGLLGCCNHHHHPPQQRTGTLLVRYGTVPVRNWASA